MEQAYEAKEMKVKNEMKREKQDLKNHVNRLLSNHWYANTESKRTTSLPSVVMGVKYAQIEDLK